METSILDASQTDQAVALLRGGELVALPTETVYGLAADAGNDAAVEKVFTAKGRPAGHPLIVHLESLEHAHDWVEGTPSAARRLAERFWPGPLTMILRKAVRVSNRITGGLDTVALRVPDHPVAAAVIRGLGRGIVAPSANAHKKTSPTRPEHVLRTLAGRIAAIVDAGPCRVGIESTIVDMTRDVPVVLRPGAVTPSMIEEALGVPVETPWKHAERVPGNMQAHYQPEKPLLLVPGRDLEAHLQRERHVAVVHHSRLAHSADATFYRMSADRAEYARSLYETLHRIDNTDVEKILVESPPAGSDWADVLDRLSKAAAK